MAQRLQIVADKSDSDEKCCANPSPVWETMSVSCQVCSKILDDMARPDLGRKRIDGFFHRWIETSSQRWLSNGQFG